ncbi:MAG TPA: hypothetical protein VJ970_04775, partial [Flavobacteriaceae bacterium]|nr:hypothetical protein [Flavobacteriaceae bacterium]
MKGNKSILNLLLLLSWFFVSYSQNLPPQIFLEGEQIYCPQSEINVVTNFDIIDPDDEGIEAVYIQIST